MNTSAQIRMRINKNSMWFSCRFKTGGFFKFTVTRYSTELTGASLGNDIDDDLDVVLRWISKRHTTSVGNLFKDLERICKRCNTGLDLINTMNHGS